jgi:uncharacterized protein (DUF924 family)
MSRRVAESLPVCAPAEILSFWFEECSSDVWFNAPAGLDERMRGRFRETHLALARVIPELWRESAANRLASIIVLDQFPRNIYRGTPLSFATDCLALREAKAALDVGADQAVPPERRPFFYIPFQHAEDIAEQERSVALFTAHGDKEHLEYARRHQEVIAAFGRFPHRNAILGRASNAAELEYLSKPDAGF